MYAIRSYYVWDRLRTRPDYMRGARRRPPRAGEFDDVEQQLGLIEQVIRGDEEDPALWLVIVADEPVMRNLRNNFV